MDVLTFPVPADNGGFIKCETGFHKGNVARGGEPRRKIND